MLLLAPVTEVCYVSPRSVRSRRKIVKKRQDVEMCYDHLRKYLVDEVSFPCQAFVGSARAEKCCVCGG